MRLLLTLFFQYLFFFLVAQTAPIDSLEDDRLPEMVISANRQVELKSDIPNEVDVLGKKRLQAVDPLSTADALEESGSVFVQRSQQGGGSPVIRGFEANRVLLVMDGVRMNNAIFRSGHLQNSITTDPSMMERIEVLHGAGSVIYGTDAIGGVVSFFTKKPQLSFSDKAEWKSRAYARYATANQGKTLHADINGGYQNWATLTGITVSDFGDLHMGSKDFNAYPDFGLRTWSVDRINNQDSIVQNEKPRVQLGSAYKQIDVLQKFLFSKGGAHRHEVNLQFSTSSEVPRYDRLAQLRDGLPRSAEWSYGPQKRLFATYSWIFSEKKKAFDGFRLTPAFQKIQESRITRNFNNPNRRTQTEDLKIFSVNADFFKNIKAHELRYGAELVHNDLESVGESVDIETAAQTDVQSRYPSGGYSTAGLYISHRWELWNRKFILSDGFRLSAVNVKANFDKRFFTLDDFQKIEQQSASLNWNVGGVLALPKQFRINTLLSTGFRNPNIDDLGKTFELNDGGLIVPNPNATAEQVFYQELGLTKAFSQGSYISGTAFLSNLKDALVRRPYQVNGQDSTLYEGQLLETFSNINIGKARVWGLSADSRINILDNWTARGSLTFTRGKDITVDVPLDHIPPLFGNVSIQFAEKKWEAEVRMAYNGWKRVEDYSPTGSDNPQYATIDGTPAWRTYNLRGAYTISDAWKVQASLENLFDRNYRNFASGINASGRNLIVTLIWTQK